jgi:uncharacterized protein YutE (UPF0331/DUF86 family)
MDMVENDVIRSKLRHLKEYLEDLSEYRGISLSDYSSSKKDQRFVERTLHLACECCIDVAAHIVSRKSLRPARDNKDLFNVLEENGIITASVSSSMKKMAQFRNIVVYDYARIDPAIVVAILQRNIDDFKNFAAEVLARMPEPAAGGAERRGGPEIGRR